jgi:hypothetical protein
LPSLCRRERQCKFVGFIFFEKNHQGINLRECSELSRQRDAVWGGIFFAPVIDGRFDVGDVDASHSYFEGGSRS